MAATLHHKYSIMLVAIASLIIIAMTLIPCVLQDQGSAYKFNGTQTYCLLRTAQCLV